MPKIRSLKSDYFKSEDVSIGGADRWPLAAVVKALGAGLICCLADDEGRCKASVTDIKAEVFRHDSVNEEQIGEALTVLDRLGVIQLYVVEKRGYIQISNWERHQYIPPKRRQPSSLPSAPARRPHGTRMARAVRTHDVSTEGAGPRARGGMDRDRDKDREGSCPPSRREDVDALCSRMATLVGERTESTIAITEDWRVETRRMIDIDKRPYDQAAQLVEWVHAHHFWRKNVLGMPKFRKQYGRLLMEMRAEKPVRPALSPEDAERRAAQDAWLRQGEIHEEVPA